MKKLTRFLIALCAVSAAIAAGLISCSLFANSGLQKDFQRKENAYPYEEALAKDGPDLNTIQDLYSGVSSLLGFDETIIESPAAIRYYADPDDRQPAYVIEKGTVIHIGAEIILNGGMDFRGIGSLPTDQAGWRLSKPFAEEGKAESEALMYVRLSDLQPVAAAWTKENPNTMKWMRAGMKQQKLLPTKANARRYLLLSNDRLLYSKGVYLSKDLMNPVLSPAAIICLCISAILLAGILWIKSRNRKI